MNVTTDRSLDVSIVRVRESRLMYPLLPEFTGTVVPLIVDGSKVLLDLSTVTYVDSATIGCLKARSSRGSTAGAPSLRGRSGGCAATTSVRRGRSPRTREPNR